MILGSDKGHVSPLSFLNRLKIDKDLRRGAEEEEDFNDLVKKTHWALLLILINTPPDNFLIKSVLKSLLKSVFSVNIY